MANTVSGTFNNQVSTFHFKFKQFQTSGTGKIYV